MSTSSQRLPASDFKKNLDHQKFYVKLYRCIDKNQEEKVIELLQSQASFILPHNEEYPLLHLALSRQFSLDCIKLLYPFVPYPHLWNKDKQTAIHLAAAYETDEILKYFIKNHLEKFKDHSIAYVIRSFINEERLDIVKLIFANVNFYIPLYPIECKQGLQLALGEKDVDAVKFFLHFFLAVYDKKNLCEVTDFFKSYDKLLFCLSSCLIPENKLHLMRENALIIIFKLINGVDDTNSVRDIYQQMNKITWLSSYNKFEILLYAKSKIIALCQSESYEEDSRDKQFLKTQLSKENLFNKDFYIFRYEEIMKNKKTKECWCLIL